MNKSLLGVVAVLGLMIVGGYLVFSNPEKTDDVISETETIRRDTQVGSETESKGVRHVVSYDGASFSFVLPEGWTFTSWQGYGPEYITSLATPGEEIYLTLTISGFPSSDTTRIETVKSFTGVGGEVYYWQPFTGNSVNGDIASSYFLSACELIACKIVLNEEYRLNVSISRPPEIGQDPKSIDITSKVVEEFEEIISSIDF